MGYFKKIYKFICLLTIIQCIYIHSKDLAVITNNLARVRFVSQFHVREKHKLLLLGAFDPVTIGGDTYPFVLAFFLKISIQLGFKRDQRLHPSQIKGKE